MIVAMDRDKRITTTAVVAGALAAIRGQKRSGVNDVISHSCQQKRCLMGGAQDTRTSIKMGYEDPLIFSLTAENSFALVERFRRGCKPNSRWQVQ
jgi:hypothetical protein